MCLSFKYAIPFLISGQLKNFQAVLERGVLTYFNNRADAMSGVKRKDWKYLDGAQGMASDIALSAFTIMFSDGSIHRLSVPVSCEDSSGELTRMVSIIYKIY